MELHGWQKAFWKADQLTLASGGSEHAYSYLVSYKLSSVCMRKWLVFAQTVTYISLPAVKLRHCRRIAQLFLTTWLSMHYHRSVVVQLTFQVHSYSKYKQHSEQIIIL